MAEKESKIGISLKVLYGGRSVWLAEVTAALEGHK
jgi:hypothetical protein